tara:strand:- start:104 stop:415 length:312 start_codon:yes stop_codon:yes gene_type:complete
MGDKTQHFIAKSYITPIFESTEYVTEYHLYWYNSNKNSFEDAYGYTKMSYKKMNKKELLFFKSSSSKYELVLENEHGCVWENKALGFDKDKVTLSQFSIDWPT